MPSRPEHSRLRVAYVLHQYPPRYFTGTESYAHALARAMPPHDVDVRVFSFDPFLGEADDLMAEWDEVVDGVPVHVIRKWQGLHPDPLRMEYDDPLLASRFGAWLDAHKPEVVHAFHLRMLGVGLLGEARARGIPVAVHLMDFWYLCPRVTLERRDGALCSGPPDGGLGCLDCMAPEVGSDLDPDTLELLRTSAPAATATTPPAEFDALGRARVLQHRAAVLREALLGCAHVFAPSEFLRSTFADNGVPAEHLSLLRYGIDFEPPAEDIDRRGTDEAPIRIGYAGSISSHKGVHVLVQAFAQLPADIVERAQLDLYGRLEDFPDYVDELREVASRAPRPERIHFHGPFDPARRAATLKRLDLLVVPSVWYENTPFVVLEAQACRVPVAVSALGGLTESVRDGIDGEAFEAGNPDELAELLERAITRPERLDHFRQNMPRVPRTDDNARHIAAVYRQLREIRTTPCTGPRPTDDPTP